MMGLFHALLLYKEVASHTRGAQVAAFDDAFGLREITQQTHDCYTPAQCKAA